MNVLHVIRDLSPITGGPVTAIQGMASAETVAGHYVSIIATDYGLPEQPALDGVDIKIFPCKHAGWRYSQELSENLPQLVDKSDIVHIHTVWEHPTWAAARVCRKLGKPYILRPCGMLDKWSLLQNAWKKKIYLQMLAASVIRNASALHFTSEDELTNSLVTGQADGSFVVPNGLPPAAMENLPGSEAFRQRYSELDSKRIVLFLSRLHYKKQPNIAIEAFGKICHMDNHLVLVLAGPAEPAYLAELKGLADSLNLLDRVIFTGMLQGAAVQEAYRAAEIFVLPSLQENFGIAVAEAMAASCPVIVSEQVNLAAEILSASAGIVCSSDVTATAAAMEALLKNKSLCKKMGQNGRALVQEKFSWEKVATELLDVYEDILSGQRISKAWR